MADVAKRDVDALRRALEVMADLELESRGGGASLGALDEDTQAVRAVLAAAGRRSREEPANVNGGRVGSRRTPAGEYAVDRLYDAQRRTRATRGSTPLPRCPERRKG